MLARNLSYRGKRVASQRRSSVKKRAAAASSQNRRLLQLVVCGSIFVILVALKLLFPKTVLGLSERAGEVLEKDSDFVAAFSAVGKAIAGEEPVGDSMQDAYEAVFAPAGGVVQQTASLHRTSSADRLSVALVDLQKLPVDREAEKTNEAETVTQSYVFFSRPLPEKVSMGQEILGFSYCSPYTGQTTSHFGWRKHPIYGDDRFHYGLDIGGLPGEAVAAFADGVVKAVGESSSLGKYLMIEHGEEVVTLYAHCSKVTVSSGAEVAMGDKVAEIGSTGISTGPHLHFGIAYNGAYVNPAQYVPLY